MGEEEEGKEGEEEEDEEKEENDEEKEGNMMKPPRLSECLRTVPVSPAVQAAVFLCFRVILLRSGGIVNIYFIITHFIMIILTMP